MLLSIGLIAALASTSLALPPLERSDGAVALAPRRPGIGAALGKFGAALGKGIGKGGKGGKGKGKGKDKDDGDDGDDSDSTSDSDDLSGNAFSAGTGNNCVIAFQTVDGSQCSVTIACEDQIADGKSDDVDLVPGPGVGTDTWQVCFLNGEQHFKHPKVGPFSIKFTDDSDGLRTPILAIDQINRDPIDVEDEISKTEDKGTGKICESFDVDNGFGYRCGVPEQGASIFGMTNTPPVGDTFAPGKCGIHFIQYQIPANDDKYYLAARITDGVGALIAQVGNSFEVDGDKVAADKPVEMDSPLPFVTIITLPKSGEAPNTDALPVKFAFADQTFDSDSSQCGVGGYDSGSRQGDCTFSCPAK